MKACQRPLCSVPDGSPPEAEREGKENEIRV